MANPREQDRDLISGFCEEALELIEVVEPTLVELELSKEATGQVDGETLNGIFRLFHSIKGSAGFLELRNVVAVTHEAETLLDLFRRGTAQLEPPDVVAILNATDLLRKMLVLLEQTLCDDGFEDEAAAMVIMLTKCIEEKLSPPEADAAAKPEVDCQPPESEPESEPESAPEPAPTGQDELPEIEITQEFITRFAEEAFETLDICEERLLELSEPDKGQVAEALRTIHGFKGNCGFMGLADMEQLAHGVETVLETLADSPEGIAPETQSTLLYDVDVLRTAVLGVCAGGKGKIPKLDACLAKLDALPNPGTAAIASVPTAQPVEQDSAPIASAPASTAVTSTAVTSAAPASTAVTSTAVTSAAPASTPATSRSVARVSRSIRVDLLKLDRLVNLVGELVIAETMVTRNPELVGLESESLDGAAHQLRRITSDLQDLALSVRMIPLTGTFRKMIRLVHDLSRKAGKEVKLELSGEDTEMDKTVIEQVADPLVHIVRNAIDRGLEPTEERIAAGKSPSGTVKIEARHESGEVWIVVSEDGRGLCRDAILAKALGRGLVDEDADLSDEAVYKLIFEPGFSTAEKVTEISGRGVGMDVVRRNLEAIGGKVEIKTKNGEGTTFVLRIPLTLAIIDGMMIRVGDTRYALPLLGVRESFQPKATAITRLPDGQELVRVRDRLYPILRLYQFFGKQADHREPSEGILVMVEADRTSVCLLVDEILGQQETVVKPLSSYLGSPQGVSGCTILGDGQVALILDVVELVGASAGATAGRA